MNNDADFGNMRVLAAHEVVFFESVQIVQPVEWEETDDEFAQVHWVQCTKCSEHRVVPSGQYVIVQSGDMKLFCRVVGGPSHLVKRQHFDKISKAALMMLFDDVRHDTRNIYQE